MAPSVVVKIELLINPHAKRLSKGWQKPLEPIVAACRKRGLEVNVRPCEPSELAATARTLALGGADAVVALGGDGTISSVAAGLVDTGVPMGVLPMGTMNNFSKDLGIHGIDGALDAIAAESTVRVDVGEVNGHVFVNNSSIGAYPSFVLDRDKHRRQTGVRDYWLAIRRAFRRLVARVDLHVTITIDDDRAVHLRTPFVFVGNNTYSNEVRELGRRERLDGGVLDVFALRARSRWEMFRRLVRAIFRRVAPPDFKEVVTSRIGITTKRKTIHVALDGEVVRMKTPLAYRSRPGSLLVLAPIPHHEDRRPPLGPTLRLPRPSHRERAHR